MNKTEEAIKKLEAQLALLLDAELNYRQTRFEQTAEMPPTDDFDDIQYFEAKLERARRKLSDVKISDTLTPLLVDADLSVGNVIEPDKQIEWQEIKEKKKA